MNFEELKQIGISALNKGCDVSLEVDDDYVSVNNNITNGEGALESFLRVASYAKDFKYASMIIITDDGLEEYECNLK